MSDSDTSGEPDGPAFEAREAEYEPVRAFDDESEMDLRPGADHCYKCSTCDTSCPVAEVDDGFPGPKFQGPEQWRLKRKDDVDIDDSVMSCSNCMRCDSACPSSVPLSQMHNTARGEYVEEVMNHWSVEYVRNRILANYGTLAGFGSKVPGLTNFVMGNRAVRWITDELLGITAERAFPEFARQTFREWWAERGGDDASAERAREARAERGEDVDADKRVAYFHGDYANYNTVDVAKALVRVYEWFGYAVAVPDQRCSGTPMFANGMIEDARRAARINVETFRELVAEGYDVVASCTSCSMALRQEYPELFDVEGTETVAANTWDAVEFLRVHEDLEATLANADVSYPDLTYHAPCHARNQGLDRNALELFRDLSGVEVDDAGPSCSGISGTYGWKSEKYDASMQIGKELFDHMEASAAADGLTECPTCAMQMEHGTGYEIHHPLQVLEAALTDASGRGDASGV